jgi:hypothetical protein
MIKEVRKSNKSSFNIEDITFLNFPHNKDILTGSFYYDEASV